MNIFFTQIISAWGWLTPLAARNSEGDDTIWVQLLVLVILAVAFSIFWLAKAKANKSSNSQEEEEDLPASPQLRKIERQVGKTFEKLPKKKVRDLQSGMELLGSDFLLKVVENTNDGKDEKNVVMRKLNFKELLRRGELNRADSKALKEYAVNKGNLYGKDIQCEAIRRLAERTAKGKTGN